MKRFILLLIVAVPSYAMSQKLLMQWDFENIKNRNTLDVLTNITDTIEGNFEESAGVSGKGLRLDGFTSKGYDNSQRCYQVEKNGQKTGKAEFTLQGSKGSPIINPAIFVKNWNSKNARVLVNGKENKNCRIGINPKLEGYDLVLYISTKEDKPVKITILP